MSEEGKKVGVIGGVIAAIGAAFAHGADDCARVGARGISVEAAGVRAASNVGDDLARVGARGGSRLSGEVGRGALGRGRLPGAPLVAPGVVDDMGRVGVGARGFEREVGLAAVGDEAASGAKPWKNLAEELGQEVSVDVLSEVLDVESSPEPGSGATVAQQDATGAPTEPPSAVGLEPIRIALMPVDAREFSLAFSHPLGPASNKALSVLAESFGKSSGFLLPKTSRALFASLSTNASRVGVVVGYLHPGKPGALALPSADGALELSTLHARAASARATLWVLACEEDDLKEKEPCAVAARSVLARALETRPRDATELGRELVRARDAAGQSALSIHGVARAKGAPRLVHSKL